MKKDVLIHINGTQYAETEDVPVPVEVIAPGKYYFKNGNHYLAFEEPGAVKEETVQNLMKFRDEYLEVTKTGFVKTQMVFEKDKKTKSYYITPFGAVNIGIATTSINLKEQPDEIEVTANYALDVNDSFVADCSISLLARSKDTDSTISQSSEAFPS